jgi:acetyl-CoA C-acetyltransferase
VQVKDAKILRKATLKHYLEIDKCCQPTESILRSVSIIGSAQLQVKKSYSTSLRRLGAEVVIQAMNDAGVERIDALYLGNMLSDELQGQKHLATLVADEAGQWGVEALQIRAATATGAAALRVAHLAVASGAADLVMAVGVEKMSTGPATPQLAKALDAKYESKHGVTLLSQNARLMQLYIDTFNPPGDAFAHFSVNAHKNASQNLNALFSDRQFSTTQVLQSKIVVPPIRLLDCSPICDGAAAVLLAPSKNAHKFTNHPVRILASAITTDRFRMEDRKNPLQLDAVKNSTKKALKQSSVHLNDIDLFELHDAFSIIACLSLEATCFANPGEGWRLAANNEIAIGGRIPISTMGGLKARGHPIGATALYQTSEAVLQLTERAGSNQVAKANIALIQSVGGVASTVITFILGS